MYFICNEKKSEEDMLFRVFDVHNIYDVIDYAIDLSYLKMAHYTISFTTRSNNIHLKFKIICDMWYKLMEIQIWSKPNKVNVLMNTCIAGNLTIINLIHNYKQK